MVTSGGTTTAALGITHPRAVNFAVRAAALGPVGAGAVTAAFYNSKHELVARHVPAVWATASPEDVLAARARAVDALLRRLLGEEAVASAEACSRSAPRSRTWRTSTPPRCASTAVTGISPY